MNMRDSGKQLTAADIDAFEKELNMKLPLDYHAFMLEHNGGIPSGAKAFDFVEAGQTEPTGSLIRDFFAISDKYDSLKNAYTNLVEGGEVPPNLLPIGSDPFGNTILISVSGNDCGSVYFGDHELEDPETGYLVMSFIADSFSSFIDQCYIPDDDGL